MRKTILAILAVCLLEAAIPCQGNAAFTEEETALLALLRFDRETIAPFKPLMKSRLRRLERISVAYDPETNSVSEERHLLNGVEFEVEPGTAKRLVLNGRKAAKEKGYLVFVSEDGSGRGNDSIAVIRSASQFDIVSYMQTDGINYGLTNGELISKLKEWDRRYPMEIIGAGLDWVDTVFVGKPAGLGALAREAFELCPDAAASAEALEAKMRRLNELYLAWN